MKYQSVDGKVIAFFEGINREILNFELRRALSFSQGTCLHQPYWIYRQY